eukprot:405080_1
MLTHLNNGNQMQPSMPNNNHPPPPQKNLPPQPTHSNSKPNVQISSLSVTLKVDNCKFIPEKECFEIDLTDAIVISTNPQNKSIKIHISTSKMKKINKELVDKDIDKLIDEIETQNEFMHNRDQTQLALQPRNIKKEWSKISSKRAATFTPTTPLQDQSSSFPQINNIHNQLALQQSDDSLSANSHNKNNSKYTEPVIYEETCNFFIGQCVSIKRIIFIMKYYRLWREYKTKQQNNKITNIVKDFESMTEFLHSLQGYNKVDLINDYLHLRKCHFSNDLIGFFRDKLDECNDEKSNDCLCVERNNK